MAKKLPFRISWLVWMNSSQSSQRLHPLFILLFFFSFSMVNAETILCPGNKNIDQLIDQAISLGNNGKNKEALRLLQKAYDLAKAIECEKGELDATKNIMLVYTHDYDYKKALEISNKVRDLAVSQKNYKALSTVYTKRAILYENLGLYDESLKEYETALKYAQLISETDQKYYQTSLVYYNLAPYYQGRSDEKVLYYLKKCREEVLKISDHSKDVPLDKKVDMLISVNMNLGIHYRDSRNKGRNIKLSEFYFMESLKQLDLIKGEVNRETKIDLYQALQEFYQMKKDYKKAIEYGENMLTMEKSNSMPYNRRVGYMVLAKSYLGIGDNTTSQKYLDLFSKLNDSINSVEKQAVEGPVKKIISETQINGDQKVKRIAIISFAILILITGGMLIYRRRSNKIIRKKYEELIAKISNEQNNIPTESITTKDNTEAKTSVSMTDETVKALLAKLEKFERSEKYLRKDISVTWMANHFNTNTKYLSEIIKIYRDKNFTTYINGLRIGYITKKLYENPIYREYKISYLSEECGYATPQVFVTAFKKETGFTPSYFLEHLRVSI